MICGVVAFVGTLMSVGPLAPRQRSGLRVIRAGRCWATRRQAQYDLAHRNSDHPVLAIRAAKCTGWSLSGLRKERLK